MKIPTLNLKTVLNATDVGPWKLQNGHFLCDNGLALRLPERAIVRVLVLGVLRTSKFF